MCLLALQLMNLIPPCFQCDYLFLDLQDHLFDPQQGHLFDLSPLHVSVYMCMIISKLE